jgi:hypothetical protein
VPRPASARVAASRGAALRDGVPALVAFALGWALVAWRTAGSWSRAFRVSTWIRRDSGQYLKIAAHGYRDTTHCAGAQAMSGQVVHLCGDVTWFPAYSGLLRAVSEFGLSLPVAGLVVALSCWYFALVMVWLLTAGAPASSRWACLLLAAVFPGQVYFAAVFPISMCALFMLLAIYAATVTHRPLLASAAAFVAGATYPLGIALAAGLLVAAVVRDRRSVLACGAGAVGAVLGFAAVLGYSQLAVGKWNAYFITERNEYGVHSSAPWRTFTRHISPLWRGPGWSTHSASYITADQSVLVAVLIAIGVGLTVVPAVRRRARGVAALDLALLATAVVVWLIPYIGGGSLSIYRSEACVIVIVPLLRRLRWWQLAPLIAFAAWVAAELAPLFEKGTLI